MSAWNTLLGTPAGLMTLVGILFMICMSVFISWFLRKKIREEESDHK